MKAIFVIAATFLTANVSACASEPRVPDRQADAESRPDTVVLAEAEGQVPAEAAPATPRVGETVPESALPVEARFARWKQGFIARMGERYGEDVARRVLGDMRMRPELLEQDANQAEFTKPVWSYLDGAVSASRVRPGRENLVAYADVFDAVEARYNVPREVLAAVWGLESQYGTVQGDYPVADSLATFAFEGRRSEMFTQQLEALVGLVAAGKLDPDDLLGGWAGAMGMTQFMPLTIRDYAVDFDGNGLVELRSSEADALGSAAHYLSRFGWVPGLPPVVEVNLPSGFDYALADSRTQRSTREWARLGVTDIDGAALPDADAKLMLLAGARGPAFLTFKNFDVIKRYNASTSYALAIAGLATTFEGGIPVVRDWPRDDQPLSLTQKTELQQRLLDLGYDPKGVDGIVGPGTRAAIRAWQADNGLPADGYVELELFRRIMGG